MVKQVLRAVKPKSGFSHFVHLAFTSLIPLLVYVFVQWRFVPLALSVILLSKWRMLAVRPRHWWPNIRANAVDLMVGISVLVFMLQSSTDLLQLVWAIMYGVWLILIKPKSGAFFISIQSIIGQTSALMALFLAWPDKPTIVLLLSAGIICYLSARHFLATFDEPHTPLYAHTWGYFGAAITWLLSHWLLFYGVLAQPTLLLTVIGFGLGALYYLEQTDRLSVVLRREFVYITILIVVAVILFSDWGDKTI